MVEPSPDPLCDVEVDEPLSCELPLDQLPEWESWEEEPEPLSWEPEDQPELPLWLSVMVQMLPPFVAAAVCPPSHDHVEPSLMWYDQPSA